jgi:hypothetical protein
MELSTRGRGAHAEPAGAGGWLRRRFVLVAA